MGTGKYDVLIVDDDEDTRKQIKAYFESGGLRVLMASTIKGAIALTHKNPNIVIALIDWRMRESETPPLFRLFKKNAEHRVITYAYTADGSHEIHMRARAAGAKRFFVKSTPLDLIQDYMDEDYETVKDYAFDDMTKLLNERGFQMRVLAHLEAARDRPEMDLAKTFSMLYVDIDGFKEINDKHGHDVGDQAIKVVAEILNRCTRREPLDFVARFHGDEFVIMLSGMHEEETVAKAKSLKSEVAGTTFLSNSGEVIPLSISIGVAELSREDIGRNAEKSLEGLTKTAECRMREDKGDKGR